MLTPDDDRRGSGAATSDDTSHAPSEEPKAAPTPVVVRSYLGPGCVFEGEFIGQGSLECHGLVDGRVEIDGEIVVGERGRVRADLAAVTVMIQGRLEGNATGTEKVEVGETGHVQGDVRAPAVAFAEGAFFEGSVEMRSVGPKSGAR